jgi:ornithine cyclodeaminase
VSSLLVLSDADVRSLLTPRAAIDSQRAALTAAAEGRVTAAGVLSSADPADDSLVFAHTGAVAGETGVTCKFGLQVPGNGARGLPSVHAVVMVLRPGTGEPLACMNGTALTALRTAAGVAAAAEVLARPDATTLGLVGAGVQAREAARMIAAVRPLSQILVSGRTAGAGAVLAAELAGELGVPAGPAGAEELSARSDIIVTVTTSRKPVVRGTWLRPGVTVLTVGSYEPGRRELDLDATRLAGATFTDDVSKALVQCGMLVEATEHGITVDPQPVGEVIAGRRPGRRSPQDVLLFHCTGLGVQDAALAAAVLEQAATRQAGKTVAF